MKTIRTHYKKFTATLYDEIASRLDGEMSAEEMADTLNYVEDRAESLVEFIKYIKVKLETTEIPDK